MSDRSFRMLGAAALLTVTSVLAACSSPTPAAQGPLSKSGDSAAHPEWSQYTFTIGDNGGDGSEELSKVTGAFDDAPYKIKFARFDYGPPLVQAAAAGDIDLGYVGTVPPITGAAQQYGFKIVATQHGIFPNDPSNAVSRLPVRSSHLSAARFPNDSGSPASWL